MTKCTIKRTFPFSKDGIDTQTAKAGEERDDIPADLIEGLEKEGYLSTESGTKSIAGASENKMVESAPENKEPEATVETAKAETVGGLSTMIQKAQAIGKSCRQKV